MITPNLPIVKSFVEENVINLCKAETAKRIAQNHSVLLEQIMELDVKSFIGLSVFLNEKGFDFLQKKKAETDANGPAKLIDKTIENEIAEMSGIRI